MRRLTVRDTVRTILVPLRPTKSFASNAVAAPDVGSLRNASGQSAVPPRQQQHLESKKDRTDDAVPPLPEALDPQVAAERARLRYVSDASPGITRHPAKGGFDYCLPDGALVSDVETPRRIRALAIPPAWTEIWVCPDPNGHLQATGRDARGRKQYRYHPRWREVRDEAKYTKLLTFARVLPLIRARVEADLKRRGLPREKVLAAIVRLMEMTLFRIGNAEYAKANKSFGLTTLRDRHVAIEGGHIHISFRGKSGKRHETDINDRRLARIVKDCRDLPGYELFQYAGEDGQLHDIGSADVNEYLREITGEDITAKDFRTWAATHLAAEALREFEAFDSEAGRKKAIVDAVKKVATHLGNTPAICRRSYIHPAILDGYMDGTLLQALADEAGAYLEENIHGMKPEEAAVTAFLRLRLDELAKESRAA
jgi:DNA topoisomerase-1